MRRLSILVVVVALLLIALPFWGAYRTPVVRTLGVTFPDWPTGTAPIRVAFASDLHLGNIDGSPERTARVVAAINATRPHLIILGGDYVADKGPGRAERVAGELTAAVRGLRAPLGVVAVLGNHDHETNAAVVSRALRAGGATLVVNGAITRGPLSIGGIDDMVTGHGSEMITKAAVQALPGPRIMVSHAPNIIYGLPTDIRLVLAGHTHCGQVVLPLIGAPWELSEPRYRCGIVPSGKGQTTIVSAGTGTSIVPVRFGAPPDIWLVTMGPAKR
jgi:predicted MPP superfamily phosphohydrolase